MTNRDAVPSLLPCPFCGSANISEGEVLTSNPDGGASTQSMCRDCGALGPDAHLRAGEVDYGDVKATHAWNRRTPTAEQADVVRVGSETWNVLRLCITELSGWMRDHGQDLRSQDAVKRARALLVAPASSTGDQEIERG